MTAVATDNGRRMPGGVAAVQAFLVLVAGASLLWLVSNVGQRAWQPSPEIPVTLAGEHYRVGPSELRWLETFSALHFTEGEDTAREIVAAEIDAQLERMLDHAHERLPAFADWYYSLSGEYSRMAMAALSYANLADPDYVENRAASMLFPEDVWSEDLERLERETVARLHAHHARLRDGWLAEVSERLSAHRVPAPLPGTDAAVEDTIVLDALTHELAARETAALKTRVSLSTLAAGGAAAAPALWRAAAARRSATAARAAARVAGRGAARAGSAAAAGTLICSPGGPAAVACGLLAGAGTWVAADWALLNVDEYLHREELVQALETGLDALGEQMERDLLDAYDAVLAGHYGAVQEDIRRSFVPARAGGDANGR